MTNDESRMTIQDPMSNGSNGGAPEDVATGPRKDRFDLEERTARFGEAVIEFCRRVPTNPVTARLIPQLVAAATSVGANYSEANDAVSKREFRNKIGTCRKESKESKFFLRMTAAAVPEMKADARPFWQEAKELNLIFSAIFNRTPCEARREPRATFGH